MHTISWHSRGRGALLLNPKLNPDPGRAPQAATTGRAAWAPTARRRRSTRSTCTGTTSGCWGTGRAPGTPARPPATTCSTRPSGTPTPSSRTAGPPSASGRAPPPRPPSACKHTLLRAVACSLLGAWLHTNAGSRPYGWRLPWRSLLHARHRSSTSLEACMAYCAVAKLAALGGWRQGCFRANGPSRQKHRTTAWSLACAFLPELLQCYNCRSSGRDAHYC